MSITSGFSTTNSNFITVGRYETKLITLYGINLNSLTGKIPVCLFANQFITAVTVISEYEATCDTPVEL